MNQRNSSSQVKNIVFIKTSIYCLKKKAIDDKESLQQAQSFPTINQLRIRSIVQLLICSYCLAFFDLVLTCFDLCFVLFVFFLLFCFLLWVLLTAFWTFLFPFERQLVDIASLHILLLFFLVYVLTHNTYKQNKYYSGCRIYYTVERYRYFINLIKAIIILVWYIISRCWCILYGW